MAGQLRPYNFHQVPRRNGLGGLGQFAALVPGSDMSTTIISLDRSVGGSSNLENLWASQYDPSNPLYMENVPISTPSMLGADPISSYLKMNAPVIGTTIPSWFWVAAGALGLLMLTSRR